MIMIKYSLLLFLCIITYTFVKSQKKIPLNHDVYDGWKSVYNQIISDNGNWIAYEINPQVGDGVLVIENVKSGKKTEIPRASNAKFSPDETFVAFVIKPENDNIRQLKIKKKKKSEFPNDSLGIYTFNMDTLLKFPDIKSFKCAESSSDWIVFQNKKEKKKNDEKSAVDEKLLKKKGRKKTKKEKEKETLKKKIEAKKAKQKGTQLVILNPATNKNFKYENVEDYTMSYNGKMIGYIQNIKDTIDSTAVFIFNTETEECNRIFYQPGVAGKIEIDRTGAYCAFIYSADTVKNKAYSLYFAYLANSKPILIVDTLTESIPDNWTVSENGNIYFSRNSSRLFFGTALKPEKEKKDTIPDDEKYHLTLWTYHDQYLQPKQELNIDKEKKRTYLTVYNINSNSIYQLEDTVIRDCRLSMDGNGNYAIGENPLPYAYRTQWEFPAYHDYYLINLDNGEKTLIAKENRNRIGLSPECHYLYWYSYDDKTWYSRPVGTNDTFALTKNIPVNFYNEENDTPQEPDPYGIAGWLKGDQSILIYDMYDIWQVDPTTEKKPYCITSQYGKNNNLKFKYVKLDPEAFNINPQEDIMLSCFDETSKYRGFYVTGKGYKTPRKLIMEGNRFSYPDKAKNADVLIWTKGNFNQCNELFSSDMNFKNIKTHTHLSNQMKPYLWGTVEMVHWDSPNKKNNEGLLYKPENFDPNKKYPMIVYFYEKYSDYMYKFYEPKPSRSVINFPYYVSNDYLIFIPDIYYKTGQPGKDALTTVVSGTDYLISQGYVDEKNIGLQGQSWGGYQVAYIVTQTEKYKAAMAGAPVSNMTSAYGGIRWESGMSRQFQYEIAQSRLGCTLWEDRDRYIKNSPVFFADKVTTPLLIMHNDNDGAVPWYQGIEYFTALKRLSKPVWMLSYNNESHNLRKRPDCKDLTIRMSQFFNHYLKGKPEPKWMKKGIPAVVKGKEDRYELIMDK